MALSRVYITRPAKSKATWREFATQLYNSSVLQTELKTDLNATLTKMDADAGITDTNYTATNAISGTPPSIT